MRRQPVRVEALVVCHGKVGGFVDGRKGIAKVERVEVLYELQKGEG